MNPNSPTTAPISRQYCIPINMGRLTAAFSGPFWSMRNGTINTIKIRRIIWTITFDGVGAANSSLMNLVRFTGANHTGGSAIIPVRKDTNMGLSTVQDARQIASAALGSAGVILETFALLATSNQRAPNATTTEEHSYGFNEGIILNSGEGLALINAVPSVVGDGITGSIEFEEV